jgi:uncharacterized protein YbjQ (UPF0145 family)
MADICPVCNEEIKSENRKVYKHDSAWIALHDYCYDKYLSRRKAKLKKIIQIQKEAEQKIKNIKLTTNFSFANYEIEDEIGIVTAECVYGMNIFRDMFAGVRDFFGGRSKASQKVLRDARNNCLAELKLEAYELGADGVTGMDLDYSEISGGGKSGMLLLVASGTAVKLKKGDSNDG